MAERRDVAGHASVRHEDARRMWNADRLTGRLAGTAHPAGGLQTCPRVRQVRAGMQTVLPVRHATQGRL